MTLIRRLEKEGMKQTEQGAETGFRDAVVDPKIGPKMTPEMKFSC
jgi:hypothetical protein